MALENVQRIVQMRDTKTNCEALTGTLEEGLFAYATDTEKIGIYTNGAFEWFSSGFDISSLTEETDIDPVNDEAVIYDNSAGANRKVPPQRFPSSSRMIYSQTADQEIVNTTDETTLLGDGVGNLTIPANSLIAGSIIRITASGYLSCTGTPTLDIDVDIGVSEVCSMGAVTLASGMSNAGWRLEVEIAVRSTGATGTVVASGMFYYGDGNKHDLVKTTATTIDTTGGLAPGVTGQWGTAAAGNSIMGQQAMVEILNPPPGTHTAPIEGLRVTTGGDTRVTTDADNRITAV